MTEPEVGRAPVASVAASSRPSDLRLARVHLRMGALDLARAELEAFAGAGALDADALVDLAEVRWRTGDLTGAGVAAEAFLDSGREDPVALAIAAEAAALSARYGDARRMAARTVELVGGALDGIFSGMPRSAVWPTDPLGPTIESGTLFEDATRTTEPPAVGREGSGEGELDEAAMAVDSLGDDRASAGTDATSAGGLWADGPAVEEAARHDDDLVAARSAIEAGDATAAADRLAELLRRRPDLAADVLAALDREGPEEGRPPGAEVDRGDPLRP